MLLLGLKKAGRHSGQGRIVRGPPGPLAAGASNVVNSTTEGDASRAGLLDIHSRLGKSGFQLLYAGFGGLCGIKQLSALFSVYRNFNL